MPPTLHVAQFLLNFCLRFFLAPHGISTHNTRQLSQTSRPIRTFIVNYRVGCGKRRWTS